MVKWKHLVLGLVMLESLHAAEILNVSTQTPNRISVRYQVANPPWSIGSNVCLIAQSRNEEHSCGNIAELSSDRMTLEVTSGNGKWKAKDLVDIYVHSAGVTRKIASVDDSTSRESRESPSSHELGVGLASGFTNLLVQFKYEFRVGEHLGLGLKPSFAFDYGVDASVTAFGVLATIQYFLAPRPFGFYFESGLGAYSLSSKTATTTTSATPPAFFAAAGWRGKVIRSGMTFGLSGGFQWVGSSASNVITGFSGLMPLVAADIGYRF